MESFLQTEWSVYNYVGFPEQLTIIIIIKIIIIIIIMNTFSIALFCD